MKKGGAVLRKFISRLAMAIALPLILFSLVKMINSKKARDLAAWKKILVRWILCFALAYFYEYILAAIDLVCDSLIDAFWHYRKSLESDRNYLAFEVTVEGSIIKAINDTGGVTSMGYAIEFFMLVLLQVLFLIKYVARTFIIMIFFIITPIIIIIHSVNLMLGKDSNILGEFFKTYLILSFMQPFHALVYIVFFFALSEIVINIPILGILFLYALYRAGNIAKAMFGWELGSSIISMNKE